MTNLLDEGIDYHQSMDWTYGHRVVRTLFHGAQNACTQAGGLRLPIRETQQKMTAALSCAVRCKLHYACFDACGVLIFAS